MEGNIFAVITKRDDRMGLVAFAQKIPRNNNLVGWFEHCVTFNVVSTWKEAQRIADYWNEDFKNNGIQKPSSEW